MPITTRLGGHQPHHSVVGEWTDGVDESIHEVAIVISPPQQHSVDDVIEIFVDEIATDYFLDALAKHVIDVVVVSKFLNGHA
jgi:hypothetical protein